MKESFKVFGRVQGIMFRQTFIRACHRRGLEAGATNNKKDKNLVTCTVEGEDNEIYKLKNDLLELKELNSWGCQVEKIQVLEDELDLSSHEVTTKNVDSFKWTEGVKFFL